MKIVGRTDKSAKRAENQDRYIAGTLACGVSFGFVCDGMGGANGGSVASTYLCKTLEEHLFMENDNFAADPEEIILEAIDRANGAIYARAGDNPDLKGMGTTLSGVTVKGDRCTSYNVGDSRVYLMRNGVLTQITEDHSVVQQLYRQGAISREEMRHHPQKNLITRAVGVQPRVEADITQFTLRPGDRILCASDGLTNAVSKNDIALILMEEDVYTTAPKLIEEALANNANDNITAVVLEY